MKKLLAFTLSICSFLHMASAQHTVSGTVTDMNNQPIANHQLIIGPNTKSGPGFFQDIPVTTNANGVYSGTLPATLPNNTDVYIRTNDCNLNTVGNLETYKGTNITSDFRICSGTPTIGINGMVYTSSTTRKGYRAVVYLVEKCSGNPTMLSLIDTVLTDTMGNFNFAAYPKLKNGCDLLMKAALVPADPDYKNYLPGYYANTGTALMWSGAVAVTPAMAAQGIAIQLAAGNNPGGPGFIGGSVLQGANKGTAMGDPVPNRLFVLADQFDNPVAYTFSDATGKFSFGNLPLGTYKIHGDAWGKDNKVLTVTIDNKMQSVNSIIFTESSKELSGFYTANSVNSINPGKAVAVYPNPVTGRLFITNAQGAAYRVVNMTGATVLHGTVSTEKLALDVEQLPAGLYLLHMQKQGRTEQVKFNKQ